MSLDRPLSSDSILARVLSIISEIAGPNRTPPDAGRSTRLWNGGFWLDSIDLIDLMLACDAAFGTVFEGPSGASIADTRTVGDLVAVIEARSRTLDSKIDAPVPAAHDPIRERGRPGREDLF